MEFDQYEDDRKSLESGYGVEISVDAVRVATEILKACGQQKVGGVVQLLEISAAKLREDYFVLQVEEKVLDWNEYLFNRAFVESREIKREKGPASRNFIHHVERELGEVRCNLESLMNLWLSISHMQQEQHISVARLEYLKDLHHGLSSILSELEAHGNLDLLSEVIQDLYGTLSPLLQTIHESFRHCLTVTPRVIVEVASSITGVPCGFLLNQPLEGLGQRLPHRLVGLDNAFQTVINALSNQMPRSLPLYSFLFIGPPGHGKTTLAKALAEKMFGSRILEYNLADFTEEDFVVQFCANRLFGLHETDVMSHSETQLISYCVIVFDSIEKANSSVFDIILQILDRGLYEDVFGRQIAFSEVLMLFTSTAGSEKRYPCSCLRKPLETPFKQLLKGVQHMQRPHTYCGLYEYLSQAEKLFKPEFFDFLDDIVVFPWLSVGDYMSIFRLQVRDKACLCDRILVYPSAALFKYVWSQNVGEILERGGHVIKTFVEELVPRLPNVDDESMIYTDVMLGINRLCFRTGKISNMAVDHDYKTFKESLRKSRVFYHTEKERVKQMYKLSIEYSGLMKLLGSKDEVSLACVLSHLQTLLAIVDGLLAKVCDDGEREQMSLECFNYDVEIVPKMMVKPVDKFSLIRSKLVEQVRPIQVVGKALVKLMEVSLDNSTDKPRQQTKSFLFLGLTSAGRRQLVESLSKFLIADDGSPLLVEVDLSGSTSPNSFLSCACENESGLLLKKAVVMRPNSVIVFYHLELAHVSVFTDILSILDDGLLCESDGTVVDFRESVIIFISDHGNKDTIAKLVGDWNGYGGSFSRQIGDWNGYGGIGRMVGDWNRNIGMTPKLIGDGIVGEGLTGLRFEILNLVDEILLFHPFAPEQLLKCAQLPMKEGRHLEGCLTEVPGALSGLFYVDNKEWNGKMNTKMYGNSCVHRLSQGLVKF